MKKNIILLFLFTILSFVVNAQVGISTITPDAATELDVVSPNNNTGVLIPIFTDAQITTNLNPNQPPHGTLIYNSSKKKFMYNAGTGASPQWSYVGEIPVINDYSTLTAIEGDVRYDVKAGNKKIYFYNGTVWKYLVP